jgi:hypothetical protein
MLKNYNDKFQNLSRPAIIDDRTRYRAAARRLRNTRLRYCATSRTISVSIPGGVTGDFFRSYR